MVDDYGETPAPCYKLETTNSKLKKDDKWTVPELELVRPVEEEIRWGRPESVKVTSTASKERTRDATESTPTKTTSKVPLESKEETPKQSGSTPKSSVTSKEATSKIPSKSKEKSSTPLKSKEKSKKR